MSTVRRDSSGMPAKGARCLTWDCPRKPWTVAGMGSGLSMRARAEITGKYAGAYAKASKKDKGRMLDEVCGFPAGPVPRRSGTGRNVVAK